MPEAKLSETGSGHRDEEVKGLRSPGTGWLRYLVVVVTKVTVVLQRNPENQELQIFKEQGRVIGG